LNCDGIKSYGSWTTSSGLYEQITVDANHAAGGGGKGQRHWIGPDDSISGGTRIEWSPYRPEVYIRWYSRWERGLKFRDSATKNGTEKVLYFVAPRCGGGGCYFEIGQYGLSFEVYGHSYNTVAYSWNDMMGGVNSSDGNWHCFELRVKSNSVLGVADGIAQVWIDGVLRLDRQDIPFEHSSDGFTGFVFPSNSDFETTGGDMYQDLDDVAVQTGRIGCLGATNPPPAPPKNLRVR
jgi:hypothetical protein